MSKENKEVELTNYQKEIKAIYIKYLKKNNGNQSATARDLGICRNSLYDNMVKFGIATNTSR